MIGRQLNIVGGALRGGAVTPPAEADHHRAGGICADLGITFRARVPNRRVATITMADPGVGAQVGLLADLGIGVVNTDLDGTIRSWNGAAALLYGRDAEAMVGTSVSAVTLADGDDATAASIADELLSAGHWQGEVTVKDVTGLPLQLQLRAMAVCNDRQERVGFQAAFLDVSGRVQADQRSAVRASRLKLAHRVAGLGAWEWDPKEDHLMTSDSFTSLLGLPPGTVLTMADALAAMLPEDRERVRSALDGMRSGELNSVSVEYRVVGSDGGLRWLEAHCGAARNEEGELTRVQGVTQDVTARVHATESLREAEEFGVATLDSLTAHIAVLDQQGEVIAVNASWRGFAEREGGDSDYVGSNYITVCEAASDPQGTAVARGLSELIAGTRDVFQLEYPCHSPSMKRWFLLRATRYAGSGPLRLVVLHADITERHQAQEQVVMQAALLDEIDVAVIVTSPDLIVTSWNSGAEGLYGWTASEAIGRAAAELVVPADASSSEPTIAALRRDGRWDGEFVLRRRDGSTFPAYVRNRLMLDENGDTKAFVGVSMDITERKESARALLSARNYLRAVTDSMGEGVYAVDTEGRLTYANQVAEELLGWPLRELQGRVIHDLAHTRRADGSSLPIEECPICHAWRDGRALRVEDDIFIRGDGSELPVAYTATPFATEDGVEGCVVVFEDFTDRKAAAQRVKHDLEKLSWVNRVQETLTEGRFVLHAQPIIDLVTGAVVQRELLLRMCPPDGNGQVIAPAVFLPVAEEYGLITEIDRWVIDRAAELAATGQAVEINVSARSISDASLVDYIAHAIAGCGADPAAIVFEITETTVVSDETAARAFVERLHDLGCQVALDDFGTGYGGFTYLKQLPIDYLKIDIEFVRDLLSSPASRHVVRGIVNLAQGFGLKTVGEGVEDQATLDLLRELEVDYAQGFHIGRPAPLEDGRPYNNAQRGQT